MNYKSELATRLLDIKNRITDAASRSHRNPEDITLLAVTKTISVATVQEAYEAGLRDFGENRVREAAEKIEILPTDVRWHFIGRLQTNKINKTLGKFTLIQSIDSVEVGMALSSRLVGASQEVLLEVNTSGEESKAGSSPEKAREMVEKISTLPGLRLRGLMTIGPMTQDKQRQRKAFKKLKTMFDEIREKKWAPEFFSILSMGMSGDFEEAIEEGSTMVRIGTALFGARA